MEEESTLPKWKMPRTNGIFFEKKSKNPKENLQTENERTTAPLISNRFSPFANFDLRMRDWGHSVNGKPRRVSRGLPWCYICTNSDQPVSVNNTTIVIALPNKRSTRGITEKILYNSSDY